MNTQFFCCRFKHLLGTAKYLFFLLVIFNAHLVYGQMEVTIDGSGGNNVVISVPSGTFFSAGGNVTFQNGTAGFANDGTVEVGGNWNLNTATGGLITANTGTVVLNGTAATQTIGGTNSTTFNNLTLGGTSLKSLGLNATVTAVLNLADRELATNGFLLDVTNAAVGAITRTTGYISSTVGGYVRRATNSTGTYLFPVGNPGGSLFRPLEIAPATNTSNTYRVRLSTTATSDGYNLASFDNVICSVNSAFYHQVLQTNSQNATLTMYFSSAIDGNMNLMAHWEGTPLWTNMLPVSANFGSYYNGLTNRIISNNWNNFTSPAFALAKVVPQGSITAPASICNANVFLTWTASNGTGPFTVNYTSPAAQSATGVASGVSFSAVPFTPTANTTYTLTTVTDVNGCSRTSGFTVPSATVVVNTPNGSLSGTTVCADGGVNGQLVWTATSGVAPFSIDYTAPVTANHPAYTSTATGVSSGTGFNVFYPPIQTENGYFSTKVTGNDGCSRTFTSNTASITLTDLAASFNLDDFSTGSIPGYNLAGSYNGQNTWGVAANNGATYSSTGWPQCLSFGWGTPSLNTGTAAVSNPLVIDLTTQSDGLSKSTNLALGQVTYTGTAQFSYMVGGTMTSNSATLLQVRCRVVTTYVGSGSAKPIQYIPLKNACLIKADANFKVQIFMEVKAPANLQFNPSNFYFAGNWYPAIKFFDDVHCPNNYQIFTSLPTSNGSTTTSFVQVGNLSPLPTAGSNSPICAGSALSLTSSIGSLNACSNSLLYAWTGPNSFTSTTASPTIAAATTAAAGDYFVNVLSSSNRVCYSRKQTNVIVYPTPTVAAGSDGTACAGTAYTLAGSSVGGGASTGAWSIVSVTGTCSSSATQLSNTTPTATPSAVTLTPTAGTSGTIVLQLNTDDPAGPCGVVSDDVTITVNQNATAPTGISATPTVIECLGSSAVVAVTGGSLGTGGSWKLYSGSCGGTLVASNLTGSFTVNPTTSTHYYIRAEACNTTTCQDVIVSANTPTVLVGATNTKACTFNGTIPGDKFLVNSSNEAFASLDEGTLNLGTVTVDVTKHATVPTQAGSNQCDAPPPSSGPVGGDELYLPREFDITTSNSFAGTVNVSLYFTAAELTQLINATNAASSLYQTCWGIVNSYTDLMLTVHHSDNTYQLIHQGSGLTITPGAGPGGSYKATFQVNKFSTFKFHGQGGINGNNGLPVEMVFFEANQVNNAYIRLDWATALEINNDGFEVERSLDGQLWTNIGWVDGNNNSTVQINYGFSDYNVQKDVRYYYRLKQMDNDGQYEYTDVATAKITGQSTFAVMNFVPNPTAASTRLVITSDVEQSITVDVYDVIGQKMMGGAYDITKGTNQIDFDLRKFAAGPYTAIVSAGNETFSRKIVLTR